MYKMVKLDQMVLKGVNWVHNAKFRSYGLERSQLCIMVKLGQMVLKGMNWVHYDKNQVIWS